MEDDMIVLGIDPGLAIVGWGVIEYESSRFKTLGYGSLQTPAGMPTHERLAKIDETILRSMVIRLEYDAAERKAVKAAEAAAKAAAAEAVVAETTEA